MLPSFLSAEFSSDLAVLLIAQGAGGVEEARIGLFSSTGFVLFIYTLALFHTWSIILLSGYISLPA